MRGLALADAAYSGIFDGDGSTGSCWWNSVGTVAEWRTEQIPGPNGMSYGAVELWVLGEDTGAVTLIGDPEIVDDPAGFKAVVLNGTEGTAVAMTLGNNIKNDFSVEFLVTVEVEIDIPKVDDFPNSNQYSDSPYVLNSQFHTNYLTHTFNNALNDDEADVCEEGYDVLGNDILPYHSGITSARMCRDLCQAEPDCVGFAYGWDSSTGNYEQCFLKHTISSTYSKSDVCFARVRYDAGLGMAIGTNGLAVYEHRQYHMPAKCVYYGPINTDEWQHVIMSVEAKVVTVYLNGQKVCGGTDTDSSNVYPPTAIGSFGHENFYGTHVGKVAQYRLIEGVHNQLEVLQTSRIKLGGYDFRVNFQLGFDHPPGYKRDFGNVVWSDQFVPEMHRWNGAITGFTCPQEGMGRDRNIGTSLIIKLGLL